jgi:iron complex outermembrane receptor protein
MKRMILFFIMSFAFACSYAQTKVKGVVKDATTNQAIPKATISAKNKVLAIANDNGEFEVTTTAANLTITAVGYTSVTASVNGNTIMTVTLQRSHNELTAVEITATSSPNKDLLYQPSSITKLSPVELKRGTGLFLDDAINSNVPGVTMNRRTVSAGQQFNIRGYGNGVRGTNGINSNFDGQGYKVYLNGIAVTDAEGITLMDDIDFGSVGSVEVTKGPAGTLYGLAIAGVVNLKTIKPEKGKTAIGQEIMLGSYGLQRYTTTFQTAGENSSLLLNYGYQKTDGYMPHNSSKKHFLNAAGDFRINDKQSLSFYGGFSNSYDERAGELTIAQWNNNDYSGNPEYIKRNAHSEIIGFRGGIGHTYQFCNNFSNTTTVFASAVSNNASSAGGWTDKNPLNVGARSIFETKFTLNKNVSLGGITGVEVQRQGAQTIGYFMKANPSNPTGYFLVDTMRSNVFAVSTPTSIFTEWTLALPSDLSITAGVGLSAMRIELDDRFVRPGITRPMHYEKTYNGMFAPHIAINKVFNKQVSVYASYSTGYKAPVSAYFYIPVSATTGFINQDLKAEKGTQFEIGTKGSLLKSRLNFELALFQAIFSDKMYAQPVPNATNTATLYTYIANGGKQNDKGVEVLLRYTALQSATGFFRMVKPFANLTYSDFEYDGYKFRTGSTLNLTDYTGKSVAGVAKVVANIGVDIQAAAGVYFNVYYHYKDKMPVTSDNVNMASSYNLLNGKIGMKQSLSKHFDLDLYVGATNITGVKYYNMVFVNQLPDAYIPAPKNANVFGGVNLKYNL